MAFSRYVVVGTVMTTLAIVAGCGSSKESQDFETTDSDLKLSGTRYLGLIVSGETRTAQYTSSPTYRAYGFDAKGGDEITVDVKSHDGDPIGYISDANYKVLALNDDVSSSTLDSQVKYKVPAGQPSQSYRAVFRDYDQLEAEFDVTLTVKSPAAPKTCSYGGKQYEPGEQFDANDTCNTCTCSDTGAVACTKALCACNPAKETNRKYLYTPQQCTFVRYVCPAGQKSFANPCGCGCEPK